MSWYPGRAGTKRSFHSKRQKKVDPIVQTNFCRE
jgi:hypothetical protein